MGIFGGVFRAFGRVGSGVLEEWSECRKGAGWARS